MLSDEGEHKKTPIICDFCQGIEDVEYAMFLKSMEKFGANCACGPCKKKLSEKIVERECENKFCKEKFKFSKHFYTSKRFPFPTTCH